MSRNEKITQINFFIFNAILFVVYGEVFSIERFIVTKWKKMSQDVAEKPDRVIPKEYGVFLKEIKDKILSSQVKATLAVNRELIALYWENRIENLFEAEERWLGS